MRCRECGLEVDKDKAFCPKCGAPMKVTADYDYIQAEIANKVDRYFSDEADSARENKDPAEITADFLEDPVEVREAEAQEMAKTREIYGNDSVFDTDDDDELADIEFDVLEETPPARSTKSDRRQRNDSRQERPMRSNRTEEERRSSGQRRSKGTRNGQRPQSGRTSAKRRKKKKNNQTAAKVITVLIIFVIIAAAVIGIMAILGVFKGSGITGSGTAVTQTTASLTSNLTAGETYEAPIQVTLSNQTSEGNIFYTLDGTEPSINSRMYNGPFEITASDVARTYPTVHLRAVSYSTNSEKSGELNIEVTMVSDTPPAAEEEPEPEAETQPPVTTVSAPQISPVSGTYMENMDILVSSAEGADIYYTLDGSTPSELSSRYTGAIAMLPGESTFEAICILNGVKSEISRCEYVLDYGYPISPDQAVSNARYWLLTYGYTYDYDDNTMNGYARLSHEGVVDINGYSYYIIRVDFFNNDGTSGDPLYLGVGINYGGVEHMTKSQGSYYYY